MHGFIVITLPHSSNPGANKGMRTFCTYSHFCAHIHAAVVFIQFLVSILTIFGSNHSTGHLPVGLHLPSVRRKGNIMFVDSNSSLAVLACGIAKGSFSWILFSGIHILWEILHKEYLCS